MGLVRKLTSSRMSRVGWGLAIVALAGAMALSFVFAWSAVGDQQRGAQARAVGYTTKKPLSDLTASQVSKPIQGDAYKALLKEVKDHVLNDDEVLRVRIFNLSGTLVFSTDAGDKIGVAQIGSPQFRTGSLGGVASVLTEPQTPVTSGLADSNERLYVTFAALRLESQPKAAAVVEVDHRYAAIKAAAYQLWRPVQLVIGVLILVALLMLVASFLAWRAAQRFKVPPEVVGHPAPGFAQGGSTQLQKELEKRLELVEESLRIGEQRVTASEREKRQIAERLVAAHEQLELMTAAAQSPKPVKGGDEAVARRFAALEAERDRMAAEVTRLEGELEDRAAAQAGEGGGGGSAKADKKAQARLEELEAALTDANAKAASLESAARQFEEERKVASAELDRAKDEIASQKARSVSRSKDAGSLAEAAAQLAKAEERAKHAEELVMKAEARAKQVTDKLAKAEERAQKAEEGSRKAGEQSGYVDERLKLTEERARQAEDLTRQAEDKARQADEKAGQAAERAVQAEQRVAQLEAVTKQAEERLTQLEQGGRQAEQRAAQSDARLREIEQDRTKLSVELERVKGSLVAKEKELAAKAEREGRAEQAEGRLRAVEEDRARLAAELDRALAGASPGPVAADDEGRAAEIAARVEELEAQRRQDVSELQRLQEALANTQHELTAATKKAKQAESSARRLQAVEATDGTSENEAPDDVAQARSERRSRTAKAAEELFAQSEEETIATRLSRAKGQKGGVDPGEPGEPEPEAAAAPSGGLSLKERLARAAAARHRAPGIADEAEER
jgi:chromosome segregation ATPase